MTNLNSNQSDSMSTTPPVPTHANPPRSVTAAAIIVVLFMCFFVLEITDSIVNHRAVARSVFFFPPTAVLLWGVLTRRRWAWHVARGATFAGVLVYGSVALFACFAANLDPANRRGIFLVSCFLALLVALAFTALGRPSARRHFGIGGHHEH